MKLIKMKELCQTEVKNLYGILFLIPLISLYVINSVLGYSNDYIMLSIYIVYIATLFFLDKRFLLRFSYIIFYITTNILGVFVIETNRLHLNELGIFSYKNNSFLLITIAHIIFIESIRIFYSYKKKDTNYKLKDSIIKISDIRISKMKLIEYGLILTFIIFTIMFIQVIDKPFFKVKLDRFLYKEMYLNKLSDKISNSILYITALLGIYYLYNNRKKRYFLLLILIFTHLFWIGHKFSVFITIAYFIALPFIYFSSNSLLNRITKGALALIAFLILIVSIQSFIVYKRDFNKNIIYFKGRLAQQGQLWWATYDNEKTYRNNIGELKDEFNTYYRLNVEEKTLHNSGIYKIMKLVTPQDIFEKKVNVKKSRYAYSTQATIFYYFKGIGLIVFSVISGILYYLINENLIRNLISLNIIPTILATRLCVIYDRTLLQSDFNKLFSIEVIIILLLLMTYPLIQNKVITKLNHSSKIEKFLILIKNKKR